MNKIIIRRSNLLSGEGILTYETSFGVSLSTKSWEHGGNLIPAKVYTGCSKTKMANRGWDAIYIPDAQTGKTGIFIHKGESQSWSKGCICISESYINKLLELVPEGHGQITIEVINP